MMGLQDKVRAQYAKAKAQQPTKHKLGALTGTIWEFPDGSASYKEPAGLQSEFRVMISEVTGFTQVKRSTSAMTMELRVMGHGTTLATVWPVSPAQAEKIEEWFRSHPLFGLRSRTSALSVSPLSSTADELRKLADLRGEGVLSDDEFAAQKAKLLA